MKYRLIVRPEAEIDIREAFEWYENQEKGLGLDYFRCVDAAIASISRSPNLFPSIYKNIHRVLIRRFPYGIFYVVKDNQILILAVLHVKRHPNHWRRRN